MLVINCLKLILLRFEIGADNINNSKEYRLKIKEYVLLHSSLKKQ